MRRWLAIALFTFTAQAAIAQTAAPGAGADATITLERGACERRCPVYSVTVRSDGSAVYDGKHYVAKTGTEKTRVDAKAVRALVQEFESLDFFALRDVYGGEPGDCTERKPDLPRATLTLKLDGRSKSVRLSVGCVGPVTSRLSALGQAIDRLAETERWTK